MNNIGKMDSRANVLDYVDGMWIASKKVWCKAEVKRDRGIYSNLGVASKETAVFIIRRDSSITKHNNILYNNKHYIIMSIIYDNIRDGFLILTTAQVDIFDITLYNTTTSYDYLNRPVQNNS